MTAIEDSHWRQPLMTAIDDSNSLQPLMTTIDVSIRPGPRLCGILTKLDWSSNRLHHTYNQTVSHSMKTRMESIVCLPFFTASAPRPIQSIGRRRWRRCCIPYCVYLAASSSSRSQVVGLSISPLEDFVKKLPLECSSASSGSSDSSNQKKKKKLFNQKSFSAKNFLSKQTQHFSKLKCDKTWQLKMWQTSKIIKMCQNSKTQYMAKLKKSKFNNLKLKMWQN